MSLPKKVTKKQKIEAYKYALQTIYREINDYTCNAIGEYFCFYGHTFESEELVDRSFKEVLKYKPKGRSTHQLEMDGYFGSEAKGRKKRVKMLKEILSSLGVSKEEIKEVIKGDTIYALDEKTNEYNRRWTEREGISL